MFARVTSAEDLLDTWHRRFASWMKPRHLIALAGGAVAMALAIAVAIASGGYTMVPRHRMALLAIAESVVPDPSALDVASVRVSLSTAARTSLFIDRAITGRGSDPSDLSWHQRLLGRPAPQLVPGREAILLDLIDKIAAQPPERHGELVDRIVMTWANRDDASAWNLVKKLGELGAETREILMAADAQALTDVVGWLRQRSGRERQVASLRHLLELDKLELADQAKGLREDIRALTLQLEKGRERREACRPRAKAFEDCMRSGR